LKNNIIILKLGGSLITDKEKPLSLNKNIIKSSINQIVRSEKKIILVHGGGSFGHPSAKKYCLRNGKSDRIKSQVFGIAETHNNMIKLNSYVIECFLDKNISALAIQPSSIIKKNNSQQISNHEISILEEYIDLGIIPVLFGDIVLDSKKGFSILSGDEIITILCKNLRNYKVSKVIFATDIDGIYIRNKKGKKVLIPKIKHSELRELELVDLGKKIDVTEGIKGKIKQIEEITRLGIPVEVINGLTADNILKSIKNEKIVSTYFHEKSDNLKDN
jgi:isopentenyl phosphate kinase